MVETLRSDPEKRFTTLLKALKFTGLIREISDYASKLFSIAFCFKILFLMTAFLLAYSWSLDNICPYEPGFFQPPHP